MNKIYLIGWILLLFPLTLSAQNLSGIVQEKNEKGELNPLVGANIFWLGTSKGVSANEQGKFEIPFHPTSKRLVVSFIGFKTDTISIQNQTFLTITLQSDTQLQAIEVKDNKINIDPIQSELITTKDLKKAACCNLSESFETNASVDVSTTDAVTGTKQIRMLGLDGVYAQIMTENVPFVRGLTSRSGLYFIPGTWVKSIDINKGAGSVVNGYESITGQINVELAKPELSERILWNMYFNQAGRIEGNLNTSHKLSDNWHTGFLLHASNQSFDVDRNEDSFLDTPLFTQLNLINRWKYSGENLEVQFGIKALIDDKIAGQNNFERFQARVQNNPYGFGSKVKRMEAFGKIGFLSKKNENQSLGIILNLMHHNQNSFWGVTDYDARQTYGLINAIFQQEFTKKHLLKTGASILIDSYKENYRTLTDNHQGEAQLLELIRGRNEFVPGVFVEYSFVPNEKFAIISGLRTDFHNLFGAFLTPRLHLKYNLFPKTVFRFSGGRGFRVANPIVENLSYLISSRSLEIDNLKPEIAWNYGVSLQQEIRIGVRKGILTVDFFRTDFINQIVTDLDSDSQKISFYNLNGQSFANSFQVGLEYEIVKNFDIHWAYKYYDVKTTIGGALREVPFIPQNRLFLNLAFATNYDLWQFDLTTEWFGKQRLPDTFQKPVEFQQKTYTNAYLTINAQITRNFKKWELYIGVENLGNLMQENPIIDAQNPFSENFDAGMIYAPVMGRNVYAGFRFILK